MLSARSCWPSRLDNWSAMSRPLVSVTPPGVNGTTNRIGLVGQAAWAMARPGISKEPVNAADAASAAAQAMIRRHELTKRPFFMLSAR